MTIPRLSSAQLWWMARVVIPAAIASGALLVVLEARASLEPSLPWGMRCAEMLFELALIGAIGRLSYRASRLWRLTRDV